MDPAIVLPSPTVPWIAASLSRSHALGRSEQGARLVQGAARTQPPRDGQRQGEQWVSVIGAPDAVAGQSLASLCSKFDLRGKGPVGCGDASVLFLVSRLFFSDCAFVIVIGYLSFRNASGRRKVYLAIV